LKNKTPLLSLTKKDFEWQPCRGSGPGGQHRNKNFTGMRCTHIPSGASEIATDSKKQKVNKQNAFLKCVKSKKFKDWLYIETSKATGVQARIEDDVERQMSPNNIKIETKVDGLWKVKE